MSKQDYQARKAREDAKKAAKNFRDNRRNKHDQWTAREKD